MIAHIWNKSIESGGNFPRGGKVKVKVVPIYKGKNLDQTRFTNYRPISLLPVVGKILEKIMYVQLMEFLNENSILYSLQYGF
jgi:hypothetical protein